MIGKSFPHSSFAVFKIDQALYPWLTSSQFKAGGRETTLEILKTNAINKTITKDKFPLTRSIRRFSIYLSQGLNYINRRVTIRIIKPHFWNYACRKLLRPSHQKCIFRNLNVFIFHRCKEKICKTVLSQLVQKF